MNDPQIRTVATYIRVSGKEQDTDGFGLEAQSSRIETFIKHHPTQSFTTKPEWQFTDVQTGSEFLRPGLQSLLAVIKSGKIDTVIIYKIDRLTRSLKQLLEIFELLKKHDVTLISIQENLDFSGIIGNLILQIFGAISEFERGLIKSRTRSGIITSAQLGNYTGTSTPFGYRRIKNPQGKGKRLVLDPKAAPIVKDIFQWYIFDEMGDLAITKRLNKEKKWRTPKAKWTESAIRDLLRNPLYRGEYIAVKKDEHGKMLPQDDWIVVNVPQIVNDLTFQLAQSKRASRRDGRKVGKNTYLLSSKLIDVSQPERKKFVGKPRTKGGLSYLRKAYVNKAGERLPSFVLPAAPIEKEVWEILKNALDDPEAFIRRYLKRSESIETGSQAIQKRLEILREERVNLEIQIARVEKAYEENVYSLEKMTSKIEALQEAITASSQKETQLQKEIMGLYQHQTTINGIRETAEKFNYSMDHFPEQQKKMLMDLFIDSVEVDRTKKATFSDGRVRWEKSLTVSFRFDPTLYSVGKEVGTTFNSTDEGPSGNSSLENLKLGGQPSRRYNLVRVKYRLEMGSVRGKNGRQCGGVVLVPCILQ